MYRLVKLILRRLVLFLIGFAVAVYLLFPWGRLAVALQSELQRRLPPPVVLQDFNFDSPLGVRGVIWFEHGRLPATVELPLIASIDPGLRELTLKAHSLPERRLYGRVNLFGEKASLTIDDFQLDRFVPGQSGTLKGEIKASREKKMAGKIHLSLNSAKLLNSTLYPPLARGRRLDQFKLRGEFEGRKFNFNEIVVESGDLNFTGNASLRLRTPFSDSHLRITGRARGLIDREVKQELKIRELGI